MKIRNWLPPKLSTQLIIAFAGLVVLTVLTISLPAFFLVDRQIEAQFWERIGQGQSASTALLNAEGRDLDGLAQLTAQRPTLKRFLDGEDGAVLLDYLHTLRESVGLDFIVICNPGHNVSAASGISVHPEVCDLPVSPPYQFLSLKAASPMVIVAASQVDDSEGHSFRILVGQYIDDDFSMALRDQTGLEHIFQVDEKDIASSLAAEQSLELGDPIPTDPMGNLSDSRFKASLAGVEYYAEGREVDRSGLIKFVALSTEALSQTRQRLAWGWLVGMLAVMGVGSLVGFLLSRRIGHTFDHLAGAAIAFQQGDLDTPVVLETTLLEATSLAEALESARQALNESLLHLRNEKEWNDQLLRSIVEGLLILDPENRITFFSPGAERISGWKGEQVLGKAWEHFFKPLEVEGSITDLLPRPGSKTIINVEMAGGRRSSLAITAAVFQPTGTRDAQTLLVFRDVSEEQTIHRLMGHFMANVSHEFRTPLSAIAASAELLMDQVGELSSAELHELISALHLGIIKLSHLVDNLIESASIETGHFRVSLRPVDLGEVIGEAVEIMSPLLDKHQQKLEIQMPIAIPVVSADPRRTVQVLTNLLSNASKFAPAGSKICIQAKDQDDFIRVEVRDRGPGVAQDYQDYIFRRFATIPKDSPSGSYGVGLGLSVVKAIIDAGGGEVGVEPNPQGGALFWFTLPKVKQS